jgi:hypothetical protein
MAFDRLKTWFGKRFAKQKTTTEQSDGAERGRESSVWVLDTPDKFLACYADQRHAEMFADLWFERTKNKPRAFVLHCDFEVEGEIYVIADLNRYYTAHKDQKSAIQQAVLIASSSNELKLGEKLNLCVIPVWHKFERQQAITRIIVPQQQLSAVI